LAPRDIGIHTGPFGPDRGRELLASVRGEAAYSSLSHSGDLVVIAVSSAHRIGVDVERIRLVRRREQIAERWLGAEVLEAVRAASDPDGAFLRAWTRAEALFKATGEPLGTPPGPEWTVEPLDVGEGYVATLAWSS
jgi:4'-phosphopantetheinyl transferase